MEELKKVVPNSEQARAAMAAFDLQQWEDEARGIFGKIAPAIIDAAKSLGLNDPQRHARRLDKILVHWPDIVKIIDEELPGAQETLGKMKQLHMPHSPRDLGIDLEETKKAFIGSRVIRDKYLTSTLIWDLGLTGQFKDLLKDNY